MRLLHLTQSLPPAAGQRPCQCAVLMQRGPPCYHDPDERSPATRMGVRPAVSLPAGCGRPGARNPRPRPHDLSGDGDGGPIPDLPESSPSPLASHDLPESRGSSPSPSPICKNRGPSPSRAPVPIGGSREVGSGLLTSLRPPEARPASDPAPAGSAISDGNAAAVSQPHRPSRRHRAPGDSL